MKYSLKNSQPDDVSVHPVCQIMNIGIKHILPNEWICNNDVPFLELAPQSWIFRQGLAYSYIFGILHEQRIMLKWFLLGGLSTNYIKIKESV